MSLVERSLYCVPFSEGPLYRCFQCMYNNIIIIDVNECAANNGGCGHTCTNIVGSYSCACCTGYTLASDRRTCNGKYYNRMAEPSGLHPDIIIEK